MALTADQIAILNLADKTGIIRVGDGDVCPRIHFCHEWDSLPVCEDSPEFEACLCFSDKPTEAK